MIAILSLAEKFNRALYRELMGFPDELPDLAVLQPPGGNTRPAGMKNSIFGLRQEGKLPETY